MSQHSCQLDGLGNREDGDACGLGADMGCWSCRLAGPKLCGTALWRIGTVMTAEQTASATLGTLSVDTGRGRSCASFAGCQGRTLRRKESCAWTRTPSRYLWKLSNAPDKISASRADLLLLGYRIAVANRRWPQWTRFLGWLISRSVLLFCGLLRLSRLGCLWPPGQSLCVECCQQWREDRDGHDEGAWSVGVGNGGDGSCRACDGWGFESVRPGWRGHGMELAGTGRAGPNRPGSGTEAGTRARHQPLEAKLVVPR